MTQNCRGRALHESPFIGGFMPAFARCCFCIARRVLFPTGREPPQGADIPVFWFSQVPQSFPLLPRSIPNLPRNLPCKPPQNLSLRFLLCQAYTVKHMQKCQTLLPTQFQSGCCPSCAFHAHSVIFMAVKTAVNEESSGEQA